MRVKSVKDTAALVKSKPHTLLFSQRQTNFTLQFGVAPSCSRISSAMSAFSAAAA